MQTNLLFISQKLHNNDYSKKKLTHYRVERNLSILQLQD